MRFSFTVSKVVCALLFALFYVFNAVAQPGDPPDPDAAATIVWIDLKGASVTNGVLMRTASGSAAYSYGGNSSNVLIATLDGHIEFTVGSTTNNNYIVGFTNNSMISSSYINYGFRVLTGGSLASVEGATITGLPTCAAGDVLRIER